MGPPAQLMIEVTPGQYHPLYLRFDGHPVNMARELQRVSPGELLQQETAENLWAGTVNKPGEGERRGVIPAAQVEGFLEKQVYSYLYRLKLKGSWEILNHETGGFTNLAAFVSEDTDEQGW